jgi:hypothetical protein
MAISTMKQRMEATYATQGMVHRRRAIVNAQQVKAGEASAS